MNKKKTQSKTAKSGANKKKSPSVKELNETINIEKEKYVRLFAEFENYKRRGELFKEIIRAHFK